MQSAYVALLPLLQQEQLAPVMRLGLVLAAKLCAYAKRAGQRLSTLYTHSIVMTFLLQNTTPQWRSSHQALCSCYSFA